MSNMPSIEVDTYGMEIKDLLKIVEEDFGADWTMAARAFLIDAGHLARNGDFEKCDQFIACAKYAIRIVEGPKAPAENITRESAACPRCGLLHGNWENKDDN